MRTSAFLFAALALLSPAHPAQAATSDRDALQLLDVDAAFEPEVASRAGVDKWDDKGLDLRAGHVERRRQALAAALATLQQRRASEKDAAIVADLDILVRWTQVQMRTAELEDKYLVPYFPLQRMIYGGVRPVLDEETEPARRQKMVARLRAYAGMEPGSTPIAREAEARTRERLKSPGLLMPIKASLEKNLSTAEPMLRGIEQLCKQYALVGWEEPMKRLRDQLTAYDAFLKNEVLPRAREDFRLPPELYAQRFVEVGIEVPPEVLARQAHAEFTEIQEQMEALAPKVAAQHHLPAGDYRAMIAALKKEQLEGAAILPHYQGRLAEIEQIIRTHHIVTLPARAARIRLATEAESAQIPAPQMRGPRVYHNTGQRGEFLLPLSLPAPPGSKAATQKLDDFTYAAASWTLTAHEARPGHELQFDQMVERQVSLARSVFAFNPVNAEGWGLYAEYLILPYMPPDGQLVSLQHRLLRAARAFVDPELQTGKIDRAAARKVLVEEVGLSDAMANSEIERYTFWWPGQAGSYFYGYTRLLALRREVEHRQRARFDAQKLHDFVLAQGLLPLDQLRSAVLAELK
jgi:uncharacterized protein (DUF885 family)